MRTAPIWAAAALLALGGLGTASQETPGLLYAPGPLGAAQRAVDAFDPALGPAAVAAGLRALAAAEGIEVPEAPACPTLADALAAHAARFRREAPATPELPASLERPVACALGAVHAANLAMEASLAGVPQALVIDVLAGRSDLGEALEPYLEGRSHAAMLASAIHAADAALALADAVAALPDPASAPSGSGLADERPSLLDLPPFVAIDTCRGGDNVYTENYVLLVDACGDDLYDNHAGGIFLAVGAGIYDVRESPGTVSAGAGGADAAAGGHVQDADNVLSGSLLVDLAGDDRYGVAKPPEFKDADNGCTASDVVGIVGSIGSGVGGLGMLLDLGGANTYLGRTQTMGAGHIMGVGVLYSGPGNDTYRAVRGAQGQALLGGVGVLVDGGGADRYLLESPVGGVWNGDLRFCDDGERYAQGSAFDRRAGPVVPAVGILLDQGGDDQYTAGTLAQGFGQGPGLGLLADRAGRDRYAADDRSQGASQGRSKDLNPQAPWGGGLAALLDEAGADAYQVGTLGQGWSLGNAVGLPPLAPVPALQWALDRNEAVGVLLDGAGSDTYSRGGRGDGLHGTDGTLGLYVDL